jgi:O-antigen/teichoic acid export membrane protein
MNHSNQKTASFDRPVSPGRLKDISRQIKGFWFGVSARNSYLSIIDRMVVSGTSFLTMIMVGRFCGLQDLGVFALAWTILLAVSVIQEAFVLSPFTVFLGRYSEIPDQKAYAGVSLVLQTGLTFVAMATVFTAAILLTAVGNQTELATIAWCILVAVPALSLREYARRYLFAHFNAAEVFILDMAVSILQLGGIGVAWQLGWLSPESVLLLIAAANGLSAAVWIIYRRSQFKVPTRHSLVAESKRHWYFGRWICISQISDLTLTHGVGWLIAIMIGTAATGLFAACNSIILILNPLLLGMSSILLPRASQANHQQGNGEVTRIIWKVAALLTISAGLVCLVVTLNAELLMQLFYAPESLDGVREIVLILALAGLIGAISHAFDSGLLVINRPDVNLAAAVSGLVVTFVIAVVLTPAYGIIGTALGVAAGTTIASVYQIAAFTKLAGRPSFLSAGRGGPKK